VTTAARDALAGVVPSRKPCAISCPRPPPRRDPHPGAPRRRERHRKDLVAYWLHYGAPGARGHSSRSTALDPGELLESELFGHEKGAFTDARHAKAGKIEMAAAGTLYFDQVLDLTPPLQAKLLRVIEERRFERVGGTRTIEVDVRFVASANGSLAEAVRAGRFREDLFHRLNVVPSARAAPQPPRGRDAARRGLSRRERARERPPPPAFSPRRSSVCGATSGPATCGSSARS